MQSEVFRVDINVDIRKNSTYNVGVTLMSQDINNYSFYLRVLQDGELLVMDETYEVEVLSVFTTSKSRLLTKGTIMSQYVDWVFDTSYISKSEVVKNYVYVRKNGVLLVSADANCFIFSVGLSAIDSDVGRVAEVYDENYEKVLLDYSGALDDRTTERLDEAVNDFNQRGDAEIADWRVDADVELEDYLADRVILKNLVVNGDFSNGTIGWSGTGGTTTAESNILSLTAAGSTPLPRTSTNISFISGRKYYLSLRQRVTNSVSGSLRFGTDVSVNTVNSPIMNQWYENSVILDTTTDTQLILSHSYADGATASGKVMQVKNVVIIDLTQTFGAGNEPSKEWMDRLVAQTGYFDEHILDENWQVGEILRLDDEKANKVQEDWITPTLLNGWYAIRPAEPPQYMKDEFGFVHFRGCVSKGASATNNVAFQLPTGYRPYVQTSFSISDVAVSPRSLAVSISVNGFVDFAGAPLNSWYGISSITFKEV